MSDKYFFDFAIPFVPNGHGKMCPSPQMLSLKLILNPDGSSKANYLINCADRYWWIYFDAEGKFEYSAANRRLTLNSENIKQVTWCPNGDDEFKKICVLNAENVNKMIESTFRKI